MSGDGSATITAGLAKRPVRRRGAVAVAMMIATSAVAMDLTIVAVAMPLIARDLGALDSIGWMFSISLLCQAVSLPVFGRCADIWNRKVVLLFGIVASVVASGLSAVAGSVVALVAFRGLQGVGSAAVNSMVSTLAGDLYAVRERARIQAMLSGVWAVSALAASALGGIIAQHIGWRWIFLVNIPLCLLALTILAACLREPRREPVRDRFDVLGAGLLALGLAAATGGLLELGARARLDAVLLELLGAAFVLGGVFVVVERRAEHPIIPAWVWRRRSIGGACLVSAISGLCVIGLSSFLPFWSQFALGLSPVSAGFLLACSSAVWPVASIASSAMSLSVGFRNTAVIGAAAMCVSAATFLIAAMTAPSSSIALPAVGSVFMGAGLGLVSVPLLIGAQNYVRWQRRAVVTSSVLFGRQLGQCIGAASVGAVISFSLHDSAVGPGLSRASTSVPATPAQLAGLVDAAGSAGVYVFGLLLCAAVAALLVVVLLLRPDYGFIGAADPKRLPNVSKELRCDA